MQLTGADDLDSTATLLDRVRAGERGADDRLVRRYLPALQRWARGRLPRPARDLVDTDDLVQVTFLRALDKVKGFELRGEGAFLAYLRRILQNLIRDQIRRSGRKPQMETLSDAVTDVGLSPLEQAIGEEMLEAYDRALSRLPAPQQEAILLRIELGFTYAEISRALGSPSPNAARMVVARGLARLAEVMDEGS